MVKNIAVIGSSGALGCVLVQCLSKKYPHATVHAFSRQNQEHAASNIFSHSIDYAQESSLQNAAIEISRWNPHAIVVGLHPGTVVSDLSQPFIDHVAKNKLFSADESAAKLSEVLEHLTHSQSGQCLAWDGSGVQP